MSFLRRLREMQRNIFQKRYLQQTYEKEAKIDGCHSPKQRNKILFHDIHIPGITGTSHAESAKVSVIK